MAFDREALERLLGNRKTEFIPENNFKKYAYNPGDYMPKKYAPVYPTEKQSNPYTKTGVIGDKPVDQSRGYEYDKNYYNHERINELTDEILDAKTKENQFKAGSEADVREQAYKIASKGDIPKPDELENSSEHSWFDLFDILLRPTLNTVESSLDGDKSTKPLETAKDSLVSIFNKDAKYDKYRPRGSGNLFEWEDTIKKLMNSNYDVVKNLTTSAMSTKPNTFSKFENSGRQTPEQKAGLSEEEIQDRTIKASGFLGDVVLDPVNLISLGGIKTAKLLGQGSDALKTVGSVDEATDILRGLEGAGNVSKSGDIAKDAEYLFRKTNEKLGKIVNPEGIKVLGRQIIKPETIAKVGDTSVMKGVREAFGKSADSELFSTLEKGFKGGKYQALEKAIQEDPTNAMKYVAFKDQIKRMNNLKGLKDSDILSFAEEIEKATDSDMMQSTIINALEKVRPEDGKGVLSKVQEVINPEYQKAVEKVRNDYMGEANQVKKQLDDLDLQIKEMNINGVDPIEHAKALNEYKNLNRVYKTVLNDANIKAIKTLDFEDALKSLGVKSTELDPKMVTDMPYEEMIGTVSKQLNLPSDDIKVLQQAGDIKVIAEKVTSNIKDTLPEGLTKYFKGTDDYADKVAGTPLKSYDSLEGATTSGDYLAQLMKKAGQEPDIEAISKMSVKEHSQAIQKLRQQTGNVKPEVKPTKQVEKATKTRNISNLIEDLSIANGSKKYYAQAVKNMPQNEQIRLYNQLKAQASPEDLKRILGSYSDNSTRIKPDNIKSTYFNKNGYTKLGLSKSEVEDTAKLLRGLGEKVDYKQISEMSPLEHKTFRAKLEDFTKAGEIDYGDKAFEKYVRDMPEGNKAGANQNIVGQEILKQTKETNSAGKGINIAGAQNKGQSLGKHDIGTMVEKNAKGGEAKELMTRYFDDGSTDKYLSFIREAKKVGYYDEQLHDVVPLIEDMNKGIVNMSEGRQMLGDLWRNLIESRNTFATEKASKVDLDTFTKLKGDMPDELLKSAFRGNTSLINPKTTLETRKANSILEILNKKRNLKPSSKQIDASKKQAKRLFYREVDVLENGKTIKKKYNEYLKDSAPGKKFNQKLSDELNNKVTRINHALDSLVSNEMDRGILYNAVDEFLHNADSNAKLKAPVLSDIRITKYIDGELPIDYYKRHEPLKSVQSNPLGKIAESTKKKELDISEEQMDDAINNLFSYDSTDEFSDELNSLLKNDDFADEDFLKSLEDTIPPGDSIESISKTNTELSKPQIDKVDTKPLSPKKQANKEISEVTDTLQETRKTGKVNKNAKNVKETYIKTRSGNTRVLTFTTPRGTIKVAPDADPKLVDKVLKNVYNMDGMKALAKDVEFVVVDGKYISEGTARIAAANQQGKTILLFDEVQSKTTAKHLNTIIKHETGHMIQGTAKHTNGLIQKEIGNLNDAQKTQLAEVLESLELPPISHNARSNIDNGFISGYPLSLAQDATKAQNEHVAEFASLLFNENKTVSSTIKELFPETSQNMFDLLAKTPDKRIRNTFSQPYLLKNELQTKMSNLKKIVDTFPKNLSLKRDSIQKHLDTLNSVLGDEKELRRVVDDIYDLPKTTKKKKWFKSDSLKDLSEGARKLGGDIREEFNKWGLEEGIVNEQELQDAIYTHYVPHILNWDLRNSKKAKKVYKELTGHDFDPENIVNQFSKNRKYEGTIEQINKWAKEEHDVDNFFETNLAKIYLERGLSHNNIMYKKNKGKEFINLFGEKLPGWGDVQNAAKSSSENYKSWQKVKDRMQEAIKDPSKVIVEVGGKDEKIRVGTIPLEEIEKNTTPEIAKQIASLKMEKSHVIVDTSKVDIEDVIKHTKGQLYIMDKSSVNMYDELAQSQFMKDKNVFIKAYDDVSQIFKRYAVMSPSFHGTNMLGNTFNSYLSVGAKILDPKIQTDSLKILSSMMSDSNPLSKVRFKGSVMDKPVDEWQKILHEFGIVDHGQFATETVSDFRKGSRKSLKDESAGKRALKAINPLGKDFIVSKGNQALGSTIENQARVANFLIHIQDGKSYQEAADLVDKFLFDYSDLSKFETNVMKRLIPFYTFMRKNVPLQLTQMIENPTKYARVNRAERLLNKEGETEKQKALRPEYLKDAVYRGDGEYVNIRTPNKEIGDAFDPKALFSSMNPIIKQAVEQGFNKKVYFDSPISYGEGDTTDAPGYARALGKLIPGLTEDTPEGTKMNPRVRYALQNFIPMLENISSVAESGIVKVTGKEVDKAVDDKSKGYLQGLKTYKPDFDMLSQQAMYDYLKKLEEEAKALKKKGYK